MCMGKIGFIGSYYGACNLAHRLAEARGLELVSEISVLEQAIFTARRFLSEGCYPVIARMPTSEILKKEFGSAIIELNVSNYSFLAALEKAKAFSDYIAFVDVAEGGCQLDIPLMEKALNIKIICLPLSDASEGEQCIKKVKEMGIKVVVSTATCLRSVAKPYDIEVVHVEVEEESLSQAIDAAVSLAKVNAEAERFKNYINNDEDAVFSIDGAGIICIFNPAMSRIAEITTEDVIGIPLSKVAKSNQMLQYISQQRRVFVHKKKQYLAINFEIHAKDGTEQAFKVVQIENTLAQENTVKQGMSTGVFCAKSSFSDIMAESASMKTIVKMAQQYAKTSSTILLTGESGVGKEIFAQSIHNASSTGPFVAINCASLPENLIESELYGYEEGSFTGARRGGKLGLFELSNGGTLFLDEIGEIPLTTQAQLLRSIQERQIIRVGGNRVININNRIICATNRILEHDVQNGTFRQDLFYRINILNLEIPPLRDRKSDLRPLAQKLMLKYRNNSGEQMVIPERLLERLSIYDWPGNVRELDSFLERLIVTCDRKTIGDEHFDLVFGMLLDAKGGKGHMRKANCSTGDPQCADVLHVKLGTLEEMNQQIVQEVYARKQMNASQSAIALGISRATLWRKLKSEHELEHINS